MSLSEAAKILSLNPKDLTKDDYQRARKKITSVVILKTLWYESILSGLEASAREFLVTSAGLKPSQITTLEVPGSFELPLGVLQLALAKKRKPSFVVALGCIVRGDTPHFDYVCQAATQGLMKVQLDTQVPVGFGLLTVDKIEQAEARASKGAEAAQAAFNMYVRAQKVLRGRPRRSPKKSGD